MLIDGEKYACEACVRGHRVRRCSHPDRQLTHINKKGRPVSQCPHCRGLRKARASRVQCTCSIKKENLDLLPEIDMPVLPPRRSTSSQNPRLLKADSDNSLTVFTNGHHKPIHRHNDSAHKCGLPYTIPIPHSVPRNDAARRSTDSLPSIRKKEEAQLQLHDSITSAQQDVRRVRSEHGSPERSTAQFWDSTGDLPPLDLSYPGFESVQRHYLETYSQSPRGPENYYSPSHEKLSVHSDGTNMPAVDWSAVDLPLAGAYSAAYSPPPSYASFEHSNVGQQGQFTSSVELSEVDGCISRNLLDYYLMLRELVNQRMADSANHGVTTPLANIGRKMRYTVHEKLQNFMAPEDLGSWGERQRAELFGSLFGRKVRLDEDGMEAGGGLRLFG